MIMDKLSELASKSSMSFVGTGRAVVGNTIYTGGRDMGAGKPLYLIIEVDTAFVGATSKTSFELVSDAQDPVLADGTATIHYKSADIPVATLVAGYRLVVPLPSFNPPYEAYLGLVQNVTTAALSAGKINAFLTMDAHGWQAYPNENSG